MPHVETPHPYKPMASYPHMSPKDTEIWNRFVAANPDAFEKVWYDFRVGEEPENIVSDDPHEREWWSDLNYWRVDVIAEDEEKIYIIEIGPNASAKKLGQAFTYAMLYLEDEKPEKEIVAVVLTDNVSPSLLRAAQKYNVEVWIA